MTKQTQSDRMLRFIREHPSCSILDIVQGLDPFCANPRARISDLRAEGHVVSCVRDKAGVARYSVVEPTVQLGLGIAS
jgi:hypothetical protein